MVITLIFLLLSVPSFQHLIQTTQRDVVKTRLERAIRFTQQMALQREEAVVLCGTRDHRHCDGDWQAGQMVYASHTKKVLWMLPPLPGAVVLTWNSSLGRDNGLQFQPDGFTAQQGRFVITPKSGHSLAMVVIRSGRVRFQVQ